MGALTVLAQVSESGGSGDGHGWLFPLVLVGIALATIAVPVAVVVGLAIIVRQVDRAGRARVVVGPPGWYPDPWYPGAHRYWSGAGWTTHSVLVDPPPDASTQARVSRG